MWVSRQPPLPPQSELWSSSLACNWPLLVSFSPPLLGGAATSPSRALYSLCTLSAALPQNLPLYGFGDISQVWNLTSPDQQISLGHRPPQPVPAPPPMEASVFLKGLLILLALNCAFTLARAFSFAFAGMEAARRTHDKLLGETDPPFFPASQSAFCTSQSHHSHPQPHHSHPQSHHSHPQSHHSHPLFHLYLDSNVVLSPLP